MLENILIGIVIGLVSINLLIIFIGVIIGIKKKNKSNKDIVINEVRNDITSNDIIQNGKVKIENQISNDDEFQLEDIVASETVAKLSSIEPTKESNNSDNFELDDISNNIEEVPLEESKNKEVSEEFELNDIFESTEMNNATQDSVGPFELDDNSNLNYADQIQSLDEVLSVEKTQEEMINTDKIVPTAVKIIDGLVLQGQGFVVGEASGIVAGEYVVKSTDGTKVFKIRTGRNVKLCGDGDKIVLLDKQKVTPISCGVIFKKD